MTTSLKAALDPASIAIVGASENPNKIGGRPLLYLTRFGFRGTIHPINPTRSEVQGVRATPRLADLASAPEMAIIAVPGDAAVEALDACGEIGVKVAVMMTSGFGETDPDGKARERAMVERARSRGMRVVGPNTQGLANFGTGTVASFSSLFGEVEPQDGPVAIVSQSGAMSVVPYGILRGRGIGIRHAHATGNDADVTACELATAVAADPAVKLLLLYLESIPDPHHLAEAAAIARGRNVPMIALKAGRTAAGQSAALSHTGALANEDRVVDAFLEQHGIWRAQDTSDLVDAAELYLRGGRPTGRRLVTISNSGATGVMAADAALACGMSLAPLSDATQAGLRAILPGFAATANPIDITAALLTNGRLLGEILPVIAEDPSADCFFLGIPAAGAAYALDSFARDTAAFAERTGKPIVVVAPQAIVAAPFKAEGLPVFRGEADAIRALHQVIAHHEIMRRAAEREARIGAADPSPSGEGRVEAKPRSGVGPARPGGPPPSGASRLPPPPLRGGSAPAPRLLNEAESLERLAQAGVQVVLHRLCRTVDEAEAALDAVGAPVALKGCSADVAHKSELGLVHLGLVDREAVARAFAACREALARHGARFDGVLVAAMVRGRREMLLGAHRDPFFGPVVVIGDGGRYVEALPDTRLLLPPFAADDVRAALDRLRIAPVLAGVRGEPPADLDGYCAAAVAIGRLMSEPESAVDSIDVNPFMLADGPGGGCALDAVVIVREA